jgi:hypothetical protein
MTSRPAPARRLPPSHPRIARAPDAGSRRRPAAARDTTSRAEAIASASSFWLTRDEGAVGGVDGQVERLARHPPANAQEGLIGDLVEGLVQLAGEFLGAGARDSRVGLEQRAQDVDAQGHHRGACEAWIVTGAGPPMTSARPTTSPLRA